MSKLQIEFGDEIMACDFEEHYFVQEIIQSFFLKQHRELTLEDLTFFQLLEEIEIPMALDDFLYFLEEPRLIVKAIKHTSIELKPIYPCLSSVDIPPKSSSPSSDMRDRGYSGGARIALAGIYAAYSQTPMRASKLIRTHSRTLRGLLSNKSSIFSVFSNDQAQISQQATSYIKESTTVWFQRTFYEYGRLTLTTKPLFTDLEATPFYAGVPGTICMSGLRMGDEEVYYIIVGRSVQAGWVFIMAVKDAKNVSLVLPICSKFYIALFYNSGIDAQLPDDFLQELYEGDSDKEVYTFVIRIEGYQLICNASISAMSQLHKILSIAYYEAIGNFSQDIATDRPYGQLAGSRVQSCKLAKKIMYRRGVYQQHCEQFDAVLLIETACRLPYYQMEEELTQYAFDLLFAGDDAELENSILYINEFAGKLAIFDGDANEAVLRRNCCQMLYEKILQYPSHSRYAAFSYAIDPEIRRRGYILAISCLHSDIAAALPVELQYLQSEAIQEQQVRSDMPYKNAINVCLLQFGNDNKVMCEDSCVIPFKVVPSTEQTTLNLLSREWLLFEQFLPYYLQVDDEFSGFPEPYLGILRAFKYLYGDEGKTITYVKAFVCCKNNQAAYLITALVSSSASFSTDYTEFLAEMQANYGSCDEFTRILNHFCRARDVAKALPANFMTLIMCTQPLFRDVEIAVMKDTGLPAMSEISGSMTYAREYLELQLGVSIYVPNLSAFNLADTQITPAYTVTPFSTTDIEFESAASVSIWLVRRVSFLLYSQLAYLFYDVSYPKYCICTGDSYDRYDYVEDEEFEYELSMSDYNNNVHPFRGPVDEFNEDNNELAQAILAIPTLRYTQWELANQRAFDYAHYYISVLLQFVFVIYTIDNGGTANFRCNPIFDRIEKNMPEFADFASERVEWLHNTPMDTADLALGQEIRADPQCIAECSLSLFDFMIKQQPSDVHYEAFVDSAAVSDDCAQIKVLTAQMVNDTWTNFYAGLRIPTLLPLEANTAVNSARINCLCYECEPPKQVFATAGLWYDAVVVGVGYRFLWVSEINYQIAAALQATAQLAVKSYISARSTVEESDSEKIKRIKRQMGIDEQMKYLLGE